MNERLVDDIVAAIVKHPLPVYGIDIKGIDYLEVRDRITPILARYSPGWELRSEEDIERTLSELRDGYAKIEQDASDLTNWLQMHAKPAEAKPKSMSTCGNVEPTFVYIQSPDTAEALAQLRDRIERQTAHIANLQRVIGDRNATIDQLTRTISERPEYPSLTRENETLRKHNERLVAEYQHCRRIDWLDSKGSVALDCLSESDPKKAFADAKAEYDRHTDAVCKGGA